MPTPKQLRRAAFPFLASVIAIFSFAFPQLSHAAANINVTSLTLASDGKTLTGTLSGGTGTGYSIANATGLTVRKTNANGLAYPISSVSISSATLTINVGFPLAAGDTVLVDVGGTNTITDNGGNTGATASSISVTNNSTKTVTAFASNNAHLKVNGNMVDGSGARGYLSFGYSATFNFKATGTDIAFVEFNLTSFAWTATPIAAGLSDTLHDFTNTSVAGTNIDDGFSTGTSGTILVAGNAPSLSDPTGTYGQHYRFDQAPFTTYGVFDGGPATSSDGIAATYNTVSGEGFRFTSSSSFIAIYSVLSGQTYQVFQDGVSIAVVTSPNSGLVWGQQMLATGLSGSHEYEVDTIVPFGNENGSGMYGSYVELDPGSLLPVTHTTKLFDAFDGDSITNMGLGIADARSGDPLIVTRSIGRVPNVFGYNGQVVSPYGRDHTGDLSTNTARLWNRWAHNDAGNLVTIGAVGTPNTFIGDYYTMLVNERARIGPSKWILNFDILPTTAFSSTVRNNYNAAMHVAIDTYIANTGDAFVARFATDNWIDPSNGIDTVDNTHPTAAGYAKMANREIPIAAGYGAGGTGYTITGPSSGASGQASTNFTVTIASGATFTGDESITLSDGSNGGTFTPSVGSATTTSVVTVTPTASTTSFTFTYTPASSGTKTLTFTNGQGWNDPSPATYTVSSPVPALTTSAASSITQTSATLNGSITATGGSNATQSGFAYGTDPTLLAVIATTTLGAQTGTASFSSSVSGLTGNTTYYERAYATNPAGTGYGSIISFTTSSLGPTVLTPAISSITTTAATASSTITATGGANATVRGFAYGTTLSYGSGTTTESGSFGAGPFTPASLGSLTCNTLYHVRAYATNPAGTGYSADQTFTTASCPDVTPPTVTLTAPAGGAIVSGSSVSVTATASDNVAVAGVQFKLDTNTAIGAEDTTNPYGVSWNSTGVSDGVHTLIAVARDTSNNYATSAPVTVIVDNVTPPVLSSIAAGSLSATGATISWTTNEMSTSQVVYGTTTAYGSQSALDAMLVTSHSTSLSGLSAATAYHYAVVSKDGSNNTATSSDQTFTTSSASAVIQPSGNSGVGVPSSGGGFSITTPITPTMPTAEPCSPGNRFNTATGALCPFANTVIPSVPAAPASDTPAPSFTKDFNLGRVDPQVKLLQEFLNANGFTVAQSGAGSAGHETTYFGKATRAALMRFQRAHGITPASGYFGPITRAYLAAHAGQ